jgi:hypothetical protein
MKNRCRLAVYLASCALLATSAIMAAPEGSPQEGEVKAAILFNLIKFIEWPDSSMAGPRAPLTLLVIGRDSVSTALDAFDGVSVAGRRLSVRHAGSLGNPREIQALYLARSESPRIGDVLKATSARPILTAADVAGFAHDGGIFNFGRKGDSVSLEINTDSARSSGLRISSKVLGLATIFPEGARRR